MDGKQEVWIARISPVVIGVLAIAVGIPAEGANVAVLVILAICVAASANFPVLILSLFWRRFNTGPVSSANLPVASQTAWREPRGRKAILVRRLPTLSNGVSRWAKVRA